MIGLVLVTPGHTQTATSTHLDATTAIGMANNKIKRQQPYLIEMRYF